MILVGITGTRGSGKGTVAQFVQEWAAERGLLAIDRGFADKLKWAMARLFFPDIGMQEAIEWANRIKQSAGPGHPDHEVVLRRGHVELAKITGRQLFQHGGTEMGRELFGSQFWVEQLLPFDDHAGQHPFQEFVAGPSQNGRPADIGTISDLRFENEAFRIQMLDGSIWRVVRPGNEPDGHVSEMPLDDKFVHSTINNDGDLDRLRLAVFAQCEATFSGREWNAIVTVGDEELKLR